MTRPKEQTLVCQRRESIGVGVGGVCDFNSCWSSFFDIPYSGLPPTIVYTLSELKMLLVGDWLVWDHITLRDLNPSGLLVSLQ